MPRIQISGYLRWFHLPQFILIVEKKLNNSYRLVSKNFASSNPARTKYFYVHHKWSYLSGDKGYSLYIPAIYLLGSQTGLNEQKVPRLSLSRFRPKGSLSATLSGRLGHNQHTYRSLSLFLTQQILRRTDPQKYIKLQREGERERDQIQ